MLEFASVVLGDFRIFSPLAHLPGGMYGGNFREFIKAWGWEKTRSNGNEYSNTCSRINMSMGNVKKVRLCSFVLKISC